MDTREELLNVNELADALRRNRKYVWWMKRWGFCMPGGTATLGEARTWLAEHPDFSTKKQPPTDGIFV